MSKILIAGGSGLVGKVLCKKLVESNHEVSLLSRSLRNNSSYPTFKWDPLNGTIDERCMEGVDYVINLAGAGIANSRWTASQKKMIIESRTSSAQVLRQLFTKTTTPKKYIAASAIGYYGNSGQEMVNVSSAAGKGFLTEVVEKWEDAANQIETDGIPVQLVRIGIVLSTKGGALQKMLATYPFKIGNYFGNGAQIYSWIHIEDLANIFVHLCKADPSPKVLNAVSPNPVSNKKMAQAINNAGNYNAMVFPAPALAIKMLLGEMSAVVLDSTNVSNEELMKTRFQFQWPDVNEALKDIIRNKK